MTASPTGGDTSRRDEPATRRDRRAPETPLDDRIGNRLPVWGSRADDPTAPIDVHAVPTEFEPAHSGGWGAPGHVSATGPIPRLGRSAGAESTADPASETVHGLPADTATTWHSRSPLSGDADLFGVGTLTPNSAGDTARLDPAQPDSTQVSANRPSLTTSDHFVYSKHPTAPGPTTRGFPTVDPARTSGQPVAMSGTAPATPDGDALAGLADFGFRTRATRALAPVAYGLLVALLVVTYIANVYTAAMAAATAGTGLLSAVIVAVIGLVAVVFGVVAGRLLIELACNVSDLASRRDR